mgnify:CR=1 FL=1
MSLSRNTWSKRFVKSLIVELNFVEVNIEAPTCPVITLILSPRFTTDKSELFSDNLFLISLSDWPVVSRSTTFLPEPALFVAKRRAASEALGLPPELII